jgi:Spy/CpxP family protein refolding chaperone
MIKALIGLVLVVLLVAGVVGMFVSTANKEVTLRNLVVAKQKSNTVQFDNMWKKNMESFEITQTQKDALYDIIVGNSKARAGNGNGGSLAQMVHEAVPNLDNTTALYQQLMNVINASRNEWTRKQDELIDINREHDNLIDLFPSSVICSMLGRQKIDIKLVTSGRTEEAFETGKDDQVGFGKTKQVEK